MPYHVTIVYVYIYICAYVYLCMYQLNPQNKLKCWNSHGTKVMNLANAQRLGDFCVWRPRGADSWGSSWIILDFWEPKDEDHSWSWKSYYHNYYILLWRSYYHTVKDVQPKVVFFLLKIVESDPKMHHVVDVCTEFPKIGARFLSESEGHNRISDDEKRPLKNIPAFLWWDRLPQAGRSLFSKIDQWPDHRHDLILCRVGSLIIINHHRLSHWTSLIHH